MTAALQHTHPAANVGSAGDPRCPACRASGRTLAPEQAIVVADLLDGLGRRDDPADLVRIALIEAVLRGADAQRIVDRRRVEARADEHERRAAESARMATDASVDDPTDPAVGRSLAVALDHSQRAAGLRSVRL